MSDIVKLVPRGVDADDSGNGTGDVAAWLRATADAIDKGDFGAIGAAIIIMREDAVGEDGKQFCLRTRRCNMNYVEHAGTVQMMLHDMLHATF